MQGHVMRQVMGHQITCTAPASTFLMSSEKVPLERSCASTEHVASVKSSGASGEGLHSFPSRPHGWSRELERDDWCHDRQLE